MPPRNEKDKLQSNDKLPEIKLQQIQYPLKKKNRQTSKIRMTSQF